MKKSKSTILNKKVASSPLFNNKVQSLPLLNERVPSSKREFKKWQSLSNESDNVNFFE